MTQFAATEREIQRAEHSDTGIACKKVLLHGWDTDNVEPVKVHVDDDGYMTTNAQVRGYTGSNFRYARLDALTRGLLSITHEENDIHEGKSFHAIHNFGSINTSAIKYLLISTPNSTTLAHAKFYASVTGKATLELFENPTVSAAGTALTEFNRYRDSVAAAATTVITHTPTRSADGTLLDIVVGTSASIAVGGGQYPWILKANEEYLLKITSLADNNTVVLHTDWSEIVGLAPSASPSISPSVSPSVSTSVSPSVSASVSPSISTSVSPSISPSVSPSISPSTSPSASISPSISPSVSSSLSPSVSSSISLSISPSVSASISPSISPSESPSASLSPSISTSISPSVSPSESPSASISPSVSVSISSSISPSVSGSISPSVSSSISLSVSPSISPSVSPSV